MLPLFYRQGHVLLFVYFQQPAILTRAVSFVSRNVGRGMLLFVFFFAYAEFAAKPASPILCALFPLSEPLRFV